MNGKKGGSGERVRKLRKCVRWKRVNCVRLQYVMLEVLERNQCYCYEQWSRR